MVTEAWGGVVVRADGCVLLREPTSHFDGYTWTFPKGKLDPGESPEDCALREILEETGVLARIVRRIPGDFAGGTSLNRYFVMEPIEETGKWDWETASIRWVTPAEAGELIQQTTNPVGLKRDLAVLAAFMEG